MFMYLRGTPTWRLESSVQFVVILFYLGSLRSGLSVTFQASKSRARARGQR